MKKVFVDSNANVIIKDSNKPLLGYKGSLVKLHYGLISSGTELSIIQNIRFFKLPLYKKILKSAEYRQAAVDLIRNSSIKDLIKFLLNFLKKNQIHKNFSPPSKNFIPLGYSGSGVILKTNLKNLSISQKVACAGSNHAEIIFSPKNSTCSIPENVSLEEAAFCSIGAISLNGIHRSKIKPGEYVGIIGTGLIGLIVVQLAKLSGANVIAIDPLIKRLRLAKKYGADLILNPQRTNYKSKLIEYTNGFGLDSAIICASTNSKDLINNTLELIRDKGRIIILGAFPLIINRDLLYSKEADLLIVRSYGPGRYDPSYEVLGNDYPKKIVPHTAKRNMKLFLKLISEGKLDVKSLISEIIPVENAANAYRLLEADPINHLAILLDFTKKEKSKLKTEKQSSPKPLLEKLRIGLIGCGHFAQNVHLPYIVDNPIYKIEAIATQHKSTADLCRQKYNPTYITTDYKKILKDPKIQAVFIYTQHNSHAKIAIEALNEGKHVFVEKPMGITYNECYEVYNKVDMTNVNYVVGFNRRYSPLIEITKELLESRNNPIIINYRISNPFLEGDHWLFQPDIGGGPIIGEVCHFVDLVLYLINSNPIELTAKGGNLSHKNLKVLDTCSVMIVFENGSIANINYSFLNGLNTSKERIEIFSGDSSIIIDDFKSMKTDGFDISSQILINQDKGYKELLNDLTQNFLNNKGSKKINAKTSLKSMELCFQIINSIKTNKSINLKEDYR